MWEYFAAYEAGKSDGRREVTNRLTNGDDGAALLIIPFVPPLIPPGYAIYKTWTVLSDHHWHPLFNGLLCFAEVLFFCWLLMSFYRLMPKIICGAITALYLSATYAGACLELKMEDPIWFSAVPCVAAIIGWFGGRYLSNVAKAG